MTNSLPGTSNEAGYLMANLRAGQIPAGATTATVLTDTNCAPDADGISQCLNDLQIGNVVVTVQHHHAMAEVPCLSPGETVTLMPSPSMRPSFSAATARCSLTATGDCMRRHSSSW